ncbi:MAG: ElyC/SanA/YdcF family protein [Anaerolineales bacterium]|nr:ElyC/SanA/YdcF family protein [Anaerolineales bacterium]
MSLVILACVLLLLLLLTPRLITALTTRGAIFTSVEGAPERPAAVVFGAGLWRDGRPSAVLRDRVSVAAQLYFAGKIQKILMSGDNRTLDYDEPSAMRNYAVELGVPEADIVLDFAGRRTYDTCYRARDVFGLRNVILVTQGFHLPRTIYTCRALGVDAVGISSDLRSYRRSARLYWDVRELFATLVAFVEVHITRPTPVLGDPQPIFPMEAQ